MLANSQKASGRLSKHRWTFVVAVLAVAAVSLVVSCGAETRGDQDQDAIAMREAKAVYENIREVSRTVDTANDLLRKAVEASSSEAGKAAKHDPGSIQQLVGLKRPSSAHAFNRRLYRVLPDSTVDDLFDYYDSINLLWDGFIALGAKTRSHPVADAVFSTAPQQASGTTVRVNLPSSYGGNTLTGTPSELRSDLLDLRKRLDQLLERQARVLKAFEASAAIAP